MFLRLGVLYFIMVSRLVFEQRTFQRRNFELKSQSICVECDEQEVLITFTYIGFDAIFVCECKVYCYCYSLRGGISQGVPHTATITDVLCSSEIITGSPTRALWLIAKKHTHLVTKQETFGEKLLHILPTSIPFILWEFLTCRKNLRHGTDGFTSPPKEVVIRIFIAHLPWPGLSP
jgi:hypothetical protein